MDDARQMTNWVDGFTKVANAQGITVPSEIQELMKMSWCLENAEQNPAAFNRAYDQQLERRTVKQAQAAKAAGKAAKILRALRNTALVAGGGAAVYGGSQLAPALGRIVADNVELNKARDLTRLQAEANSRPLGPMAQRPPYAGYR